MRIEVNGADLTPPEAFPTLSLSGANTAISAATALRLSAGDKVQISGLQTSGMALAMNGAAISVHLIGANDARGVTGTGAIKGNRLAHRVPPKRRRLALCDHSSRDGPKFLDIGRF
jgi:hypothetical protein